MFQRAILVEPRIGGKKFMGSEDFVQEAFVGYKYGTYFKLGVFCERTKPSDYPEEIEEDKMEVDESSEMSQAA